jgi:hypothetical protein
MEPDDSAPRDLLALAAVGTALVLLTAAGPLLHYRFGGIAHWTVVALTAAGAAWATFAGETLDQRRALMVILIAAVAMRIPQLLLEPYLSDDIYRYIWDGRVQGAGINPYRYIPAAPELAGLRDAEIFPKINRADYAPTIYPPAAQMFFFVVTRFGESVTVMKLALLACEAAAIACALMLLARLGLPATRIAAFAWHPLAVWEIAGSGHVDALMTVFLALAVGVSLAGRTLLAGVLATAGALVKPVAVLALPVFWRPWNLLLPAIVVLTGALLYLPYLSVGSRALGFLPGYVEEEGLAQGYGFHYLLLIERIVGKVPNGGAWYIAVAGIILAALALAAGFRANRSPVASVAWLTILIAAFMILLTPHYPWYYLALLPFLPVHPWSWTLWLLTVGGLQTYHAIPGDPLPDYFLRQAVFHGLVLIALVRDAAAAWAGRGLLLGRPAAIQR